ncbi:hypothetical protein ACHMW6_24055 [Pseudoduganella sp. UC29_106]
MSTRAMPNLAITQAVTGQIRTFAIEMGNKVLQKICNKFELQ